MNLPVFLVGNMNVVMHLLHNGATVDQRTMRGETPLHLAARANQTDVTRILLRNRAQVDAQARVSSSSCSIVILCTIIEYCVFDVRA